MADLKTTYMGLELSSPIIVGASNMVQDLNNLKRMEKAGAGAVIYKSLFEEQIQLEALDMEEDMSMDEHRHAEMTSLFPNLEHAGPKAYLMNLKKAKESVKIPVIASLNAVYDVSWADFAKQIADTGVDGLELNFYTVPDSFDKTAQEIEDQQIEIIKRVKDAVNLPLAVKLSPYYTNPLRMIKQMDEAGVQAFVLFNRLFQPQIDLDKEAQHFPWNLSNEGDSKLALRYAGLLHGEIAADICSNTGVLSGEDVLQLILAGANTVQVVSALYKNKIEYIDEMLKTISSWMDRKAYKTLDDFRGNLSKKNIKDPYAYKRAQYVDIIFNSQSIFDKYPMR